MIYLLILILLVPVVLGMLQGWQRHQAIRRDEERLRILRKMAEGENGCDS